jgi:predicted amidohydrolase
MKVAAIQFRCEGDPAADLDRAAELVRDASQQGAELIVLPELFASLGRTATMIASGEPTDGPTMRWAQALARAVATTLVPGSFVEESAGRRHNTTAAIGPDGVVLGHYRKIHLFDVDVDGARSRESDTFSAGDEPVVVDAPGARVGLTICYDLRFGELFRRETLDGADMIAVPSAFTAATGRDHWELLVRGRAVENQVALIAAAQWGTSPDGIERHGHTMVVDAWGRVLADAGPSGDAVVVVDVDLDTQADIRRRLPSLTHRRPDAYGSD